MEKIQQVLEQFGNDALPAEAKKVIAEAFESAVTSKVNDRVNLEVGNALKQLDESHAQKLETLLDAIDTDHTQKLVAVLQKVDEDHSAKLKTVIRRYESILKEEAAKFRDGFVNEISNYLELYLDKVIPTTQIAEATQNSQARRMIDQIKKIVAVDESFINENVREALMDGKSTIDKLKSELNKTIQENVALNKYYSKAKTALILEKNTSSFPNEKREYVMRVLADKNPDYVKENFNYVVEMYNRDEQDDRQVIREQVQQAAVSNKVETPKLVLESISSKGTSDGMGESEPWVNSYLSELSKIDR